MPEETIHWLIDTGTKIETACGNIDENAIVVFSRHKATCKDCLNSGKRNKKHG